MYNKQGGCIFFWVVGLKIGAIWHNTPHITPSLNNYNTHMQSHQHLQWPRTGCSARLARPISKPFAATAVSTLFRSQTQSYGTDKHTASVRT